MAGEKYTQKRKVKRSNIQTDQKNEKVLVHIKIPCLCVALNCIQLNNISVHLRKMKCFCP